MCVYVCFHAFMNVCVCTYVRMSVCVQSVSQSVFQSVSPSVSVCVSVCSDARPEHELHRVRLGHRVLRDGGPRRVGVGRRRRGPQHNALKQLMAAA